MIIILIEDIKKMDKIGFKIRSVQASNVYKCSMDYKTERKKENEETEYLDAVLYYGQAMINSSLFALYARKHGVTVNKYGQSLDFIMMKFDYGVREDDSDKRDVKESLSADELRDYFYVNGATIAWKKFDKNTGEEIQNARKTITYKMIMRNPGKAKEGHCIFVREELYDKMLNYLTMGLWEKMPNATGAKIVEMSAYAPLITATAIDFINLPLDNIFVLKDEEVKCLKKAYIVKCQSMPYNKKVKDKARFEEYINKEGLTFYKKKAKENPELTYVQENKKELAQHGIDILDYPMKEVTAFRKESYVDKPDKESEVINILWDGMGLIDNSIFPDDMEGFIYCRSHFFKSCLFRGNIQEYFKDYYGENYDTAYATDMFGRSMKISDIKVIVTENSLKWTKFVSLMSKKGTKEEAWKYYQKVMKKDGEIFEIVKTAHASKYGDLQRTSFQMNNTLLTTDNEVLGRIAGQTIEYANKLKSDDVAFLEYLKITGTARYSINNVLIDLYNLNEDFRFTDYFKRKKTSIISKLKTEKMQLGKLFQSGDNLTICGNPISMLMKVTGQDFLKEGCFDVMDDRIQCYTERFGAGENLVGFRSPHNSPNNIVHLENVYTEAIRKYFPDLGRNIIIINGIGTDVQSRLNGQDLDTDSVFVTNQKDMVELAKQAYMEFPTIINGIPYGKSEYDKSMSSYAKMDASISAAQYAVGLSSNIAQLALSYWFDGSCKSKELEDVFIICSVLAQVAIDSAKRNFDINVNAELNRIMKMECMRKTPKYPLFYAMVQKYKNKQKRGIGCKMKKEDIGFYSCPMDILYKIIDDGIIDMRKDKTKNDEKNPNRNIKDFFDCEIDHDKTNRKQSKRVLDAVKIYHDNVSKLDSGSESYHENKMLEFEKCENTIKNFRIKADTMKAMIALALKSENADIRDALFVFLYDKDKEQFLKCYKKTEKSSQKNLESLAV